MFITLRDLDSRIENLHRGEKIKDRLWWLSVGTMAACNVRLRPDCVDYNYHGARFVQLAQELRLNEWFEVEAVLRNYLYIEPIRRKTK